MRNGLLDLLKLVGALCIVTAHMPPTDPVGSVLMNVCPMALIPFFLTSGYYFLSSKGGLREESVKKRVVRLSWMTLRWFVFYLIASTALVAFGRGRLPHVPSMGSWISSLKSLRTWLGLAFMQYIPGVGYQLWFMLALIVGNLFAWAAFKWNFKKIAYTLILPVTALHFALMAANARLNLGLHSMAVSNAWTTGIPLFMLGVWVRENEEKLLARLSTKLLTGAALLGLITPLIAYLIYGHRAYYVGNYVSGFALFMLALRFGPRFAPNAFTRFAGEASTTVYLVHTLFVEALRAAAVMLPALALPLNYLGVPIAFALSLAFHFLLTRLPKRNGK